jgi:tRNA(His) 5'-end guanylyltransferase
MSGKEIGERFKNNYEHRQRFYLTRRIPVIIRIDGRAFHTFTKNFKRPFDQRLIDAFIYSAIKTAKQISGFKLAYCQSDEISFLITDYDELNTEAWFNYNKSKIESISASIFTGFFIDDLLDAGSYYICNIIPSFDSRSFNVPENEITNYFLWRALDWKRNSVSMYCQSLFSHKQLLNKGHADQHEMLHSIGKNWTTDLTDQQKNGTFIDKRGKIHTNILPIYNDIDTIVKEQFKYV